MEESEKLTILWVNANKESAFNMVFMYARNSLLRGWWRNIDIIIWGESARLCITDDDIKHEILILQNIGVKFCACIACAERYGAVNELRSMNIEVRGMGDPLTELIKSGANLITV